MSTSKKTTPSQVEKFRAAARVVETDDDEAKFNAALRKVAKADPAKVKKAMDDGDLDALAKELGQTEEDVWHKSKKPSR